MKPILLYWRDQVPNPLKVLIILEELQLPYESKYVELEDLKTSFAAVNPNGRVPAIHDPNTSITLFESCAIINYLVTTYDNSPTPKLTYPASSPLIHEILSWAFFQASGQGPYFGQYAWFRLFHQEQLPSAQKRYADEIKRVVGVLDSVLASKKKESKDTKKDETWLVGDKCTWADLVWISWNMQIGFLMNGREDQEPHEWDPNQFPAFKAWNDALLARPAVGKAMAKLGDKAVSSSAAP